MEESPHYYACLLNELKKEYPLLGQSFLLRESCGDPLDVLVLTILSQATNDTNSGRAFSELKRRFPTWAAVMEADVAEIEDAIRVGGLAAQKAARIKRILQKIYREAGSVSLEHIKEWDTGRIVEYLSGFEGVGPKTVACVLLFGLDRPAFPVDTHVLRVSKRLGIAGDRDDAGKTQRTLEEKIPPEMMMDLHLGLIEHGRRTCRPGKPGCPSCSLRTYCRRHGVKDFTLRAEKP